MRTDNKENLLKKSTLWQPNMKNKIILNKFTNLIYNKTDGAVSELSISYLRTGLKIR